MNMAIPPLHAAAHEGHLDQIPAGLITAALLATRNYEGVTPLATAMRRGHIEQLPDELRPKVPGLVQRTLIKLGLAQARQY